MSRKAHCGSVDPAPASVFESGSVRPASSTITLALAIIGFAACASDPENQLTPGYEGAPGAKRFLVCAPNTVIALPAEMQASTQALREQVDAYLKFHERDAQWLDLYQSKQVWGEALSAAKAAGTVEKTPVYVANALAKQYQFDALVMPSLIVHKTRATDSGASWDGVSKRMEVLNPPRRPAGRGQSTRADGIQYGGISGDVMVTSVHVLVFTREGERVFEGRGGINFVHDIDMSQVGKKGQWAFRLRDFARDLEALREGIAIAFHPYLTEPDE